MPSWPVHIAIAKEVNKKLHLNEDDFVIGNVLPDVLTKFGIENPSIIIDKRITHFWNNQNADIDLFINKYKKELKNPIVLGYLSHLLADSYFNDYFYSKYTQVKNNEIFLKNEKMGALEIRKIKHHDFNLFSEFLEGKLGNEIIQTQNTLNLINKLEFTFTNDDLVNTIDKINELINKKYNYKNNYMVLSEQELNIVLKNTINYIIQFIEELSNIMIISDFDQTIYQNKNISADNIKMINEFRKQGNLFVIATGRCLSDIMYFREKYGLNFDYVICNQGAVVADNQGNILVSKTIAENDVMTIYNYLTEIGLEQILAFDEYNRGVPLKGTNITKIKVEIKLNSNILAVKKNIEANCPNTHVYLFKDEDHITKEFDIVSNGVSKLNAIKILNEKLNMGRIITIGDNLNDLEMIKKYEGYCVEKAIEDVKKESLKIYKDIATLIKEILTNTQ